MGTIRQDMIALLQEQVMDRRELSQRLSISEKEVDRHLLHVARSATARGMAWVVEPAVCVHCRYAFKKRLKLTPPGKCPRCRQSRIRGPWYRIRAC